MQVDWLTLLLAAIAVISLVCALFATRSAHKRGTPLPVWGKTLQAGGIVAVLCVAVIQFRYGQ